MDLSQADIARFRDKTDELDEDSCWEWRGAKYQNGYGMVSLKRGKRKTFSAHRVSWSLWNQATILPGVMICHTCDNRGCVNPKHLYAGTGVDNNNDTVRRNRGNRKIGEDCSWAKLTKENVQEILESKEKQAFLAKKFNLSQSTVSQIKSGKRWKHLSGM